MRFATFGAISGELRQNVVLGLHEEWDLKRCLFTGICLAAACLADATCTAGVKSLSHSLSLAKKYGFRPRLDGE